MSFKGILATTTLVVFFIVCASNDSILRSIRTFGMPIQIAADSVNVDSVIAFGRKYLGKPYCYKGDAPWSLDCSGFISHIYSQYGVKISKSATAMENNVDKIDFKDVAKGDILFFKGRDSKSNSVGHVALVTEVGVSSVQMMHSCNRGIITEVYPGLDYYRSRFLFAGRLKGVAYKYNKAVDLFADTSHSAADTLVIIGVGDMMLGTNYPSESYLPPNGGRDILAPVKSILQSADVTFGNLEGTILSGAGTVKSCNDPSVCYAFKSPDSYVNHFSDAGFDVLSLANNHSGDFGSAGKNNTVKLLKEKGIAYAGFVDCPYTTFEKGGVTYGFCAFAPNNGTVNINDSKNAVKIVQRLDSISDVVIVSFHGGAEGSGSTHITRKQEIFLGENRGNPYQFARDVIDAGADLVFGHGPHVSRAVDLYKNRFIAYSMGNFATYGRFNLKAQAGIAPIVKINILKDGTFLNGELVSIHQLGEGGPQLDSSHTAAMEIKKLTSTDIPECSLIITDDGKMTVK